MRHMPKVEDFLVRLLLYIPGDIVALYLILAGFISGRHSALAWGVFGFCLLCSVWAVLAGYSWAKRRQGAASEPKPWFRICAAPVAFTVWAVSLPDSPFDALWLFGESWVKSSILCCGSLVIGLAAQQFDTSSGR
ncbi:hypothetical protein BKG66_06060 [Mycobacteroides chelonae]|nr:hypothetical protein BKG66_06060 [Mycobacteroides chelonae]